MAYNGQTWQSTAGADRRGEFAMAGGQALAQGIASAGQSFTDLLKQKIGAKQETDFITAQWDQLPNKTPEDDQKFHSGSLSTKRGLYTSAVTWMNEQMQGTEKAAAEEESKRRWDLTHNLATANAANQAAYNQSRIDQANKPPLPVETLDVPQKPGVSQVVTQGGVKGIIPAAPAAPTGLQTTVDPVTGLGAMTYNGKPIDPSNLGTMAENPGWSVTGQPKQKWEPLAPPGSQTGSQRPFLTQLKDGRVMATYPDGHMEEVLIPDEDNTKAGQGPELRRIPGAQGAQPAALAPAPAANPTAPAARRWR